MKILNIGLVLFTIACVPSGFNNSATADTKLGDKGTSPTIKNKPVPDSMKGALKTLVNSGNYYCKAFQEYAAGDYKSEKELVQETFKVEKKIAEKLCSGEKGTFVVLKDLQYPDAIVIQYDLMIESIQNIFTAFQNTGSVYVELFNAKQQEVQESKLLFSQPTWGDDCSKELEKQKRATDDDSYWKVLAEMKTQATELRQKFLGE